jgi:2-polyprenyl-6-methoxyphenol hydroxylase-like FAD-dependent oxidoreductase
MAPTTRTHREALVIGASMGGLLAARALAESYDKVTILERDSFPEPGQNRKGVPQGHHTHGLLAKGLEVLEELFPALEAEIEALGATPGDVGRQVRWFHNGRCHHPVTTGLRGVPVSRPALEAAVRKRLLALPNVRAVERCDVLGLVTDAGRRRVSGVRVIRRADGSAEELYPADLVIDASGRGSRSPAWLEALGYGRPAEEEVRIGVGYATRYYRRDPENPATATGIVMAGQLPLCRGAVMLWQEQSRFVVTLAGYFGQHPPTDEAGFLAFAHSLPSPEIYEAIRGAEPLSPIMAYKYPASVRRRYERLGRFPEGYLVFGDALCSFNPLYGQGMSVCALEALALRDCLRGGEQGLAQRFFAAAAKVIDTPWRLAAGNDLRYPQTEAPRTLATRLINWYISKLHVAAPDDPTVAEAFLRVINLAEPPPSVMRPAIALRILRGNLRRRAASAPVPAHALEGR